MYLIVILIFLVERFRVDIEIEVSLMAYHIEPPRLGHIETALHVFAYLGNNYNSRILFDPTYPIIDESPLKDCDWR